MNYMPDTGSLWSFETDDTFFYRRVLDSTDLHFNGRFYVCDSCVWLCYSCMWLIGVYSKSGCVFHGVRLREEFWSVWVGMLLIAVTFYCEHFVLMNIIFSVECGRFCGWNVYQNLTLSV